MPLRSRADSSGDLAQAPRTRDPEPIPTGRPSPRRQVDVTAVLVSHDGDRWLPEVLAGLAAQTVRPRRVVAVDTGSTDRSPALLAAATGTTIDRVVALDRRTGYGAAVEAGLAVESDADGGPSALLWLLHDDSAPEPGALAALVGHAADSPSAGLLGPKVVDWADPRWLVEVGLTTDRDGHRETGLDRREWDQGQHDGVRDVLAVGTAGALVRRDVWDDLGGLDPQLPVFRDDLDLGWRVNAAGHRVVVVPQARVRHVRAVGTGRRSLDVVSGRRAGVDRRHALYVLLAHAPLWALPLLLLRLLVTTLLRVVGLVLTRRPRAALTEAAAAGGVLLRPGLLVGARRRRARSRHVPRSELRPLFARRRTRVRARLGALATTLVGDHDTPGPADGSGALGDVGPDTSDAFDHGGVGERAGRGVLARLLLRPGVLMVVALTALTAYAVRDLLPGAGVLAGGRLLPAPDGARDLWEQYAASWQPVSVGSDVPAPPSIGVLAVLSTLLLGKAWLAIDLLLLGSVPLAGLTAYAAAGALTRSRVLRVWAGSTWALLPVATGAVAAGRLDTAVVQIALPLLLLSAGRVLSRDPARFGWRHGWALGLGLAVAASFAPLLWALVGALVLAGALLGLVTASPGGRAAAGRRALGAVVAVAVPVALLLPWSLRLLRDPELALHGPGRLLTDPGLDLVTGPAWNLLLLSPGGAGLPAVGVTAGLLLAALGGLVRTRRRPVAQLAWVAVVVALAGAVGLGGLSPDVPATGRPAALWPGTPVQVLAGALLVAALVGGDGVRAALARRSFGLRQVTAALVAAAALAVPLLCAATWVRDGASGPLERGGAIALPAFVAAELADDRDVRVLALRANGPSGVSYALTTGRGERLGSTETPVDRAQQDRLDEVVADLLTPSGSGATAALATRAVRYVALPQDAAGDLVGVLDGQVGLVRRSGGDVLLWELTGAQGRLVVLPPATADRAGSGDRAPDAELLRTDPPVVVTDRVPPGPAGRLLVLSAADDPGWRATLDGQALSRTTAWGWATGFVLPPGGGALQVERTDQDERRTALLAQLGGLLLVLLFAAPAVGRAPVDRTST